VIWTQLIYKLEEGKSTPLTTLGFSAWTNTEMSKTDSKNILKKLIGSKLFKQVDKDSILVITHDNEPILVLYDLGVNTAMSVSLLHNPSKSQLNQLYEHIKVLCFIWEVSREVEDGRAKFIQYLNHSLSYLLTISNNAP
jgi:hypothetical protein